MALKDAMSLKTDDILGLTRAPVRHARHLPGEIYTSPELFAREKDEIFLRDWLCLARVEEIEKPGDYMTFRIMGEPVIVARNDAGEINAFANVCRHRGVEVTSGAGNLKEFSCPYHGWTYDLEGKLVGAPYMKEAEGFDPTSCRLKPIQSALWAGWIFIAFDDDAPAFEDFVGEFDGEFGFLRQEDLRTGDKIVTELNCNWKLVVENLMDFYHAKTLHGTTFGAFVELDMDAIPFTRLANGGFSMFYTSGAMLPGGKPPMGNIPVARRQAPHLRVFGALAAGIGSVRPLRQHPGLSHLAADAGDIPNRGLHAVCREADRAARLRRARQEVPRLHVGGRRRGSGDGELAAAQSRLAPLSTGPDVTPRRKHPQHDQQLSRPRVRGRTPRRRITRAFIAGRESRSRFAR